jgi:D-alanyl-D-alanine carboxypeptidase (penicillin-binding protein 5/6)
LTDEYRVSENAWRRGGAPAGGSTMFAVLHSKIAVDDLLHGALIQSGNDSCIILAEGIAGNERTFAEMMTKRARELGLMRSTFANSNGLPDPGNKMTVRELAALARHIIQTYPEFYKLFGEKEFTWNKIRQQNRNPLLNSLEGADGLKTGYTKEGGYGMVGSAVQNGIRLIVVINGLDDPDDRATEAKKMLEWGFRNFEVRTVFAAEQTVGYAKVFGGESRSVAVASRDPVTVMVPKSGSEKLIARIVYSGPVRAPIEVGQKVGAVKVWRGSNIAVETPVYATQAIGRGSTLRRAIDGASELAIGLFRAGVGWARTLYFVRGRRGVRQIDANQNARRATCWREIAGHRYPRAWRIARRGNHSPSGPLRDGQAARPRGGNPVVCRRARRPRPHRH